MAKKKTQRKAAKKATKKTSKKATKTSAQRKKAPRVKTKSGPRQKSSKRWSTKPIPTRGEIVVRGGVPLCRVPGALQKHLGDEEEVPVRVTIEDVSFFALLRVPKISNSLFALDPTAQPDHLEFFLYRPIRKQLELSEGMTVEVLLKRQKHPVGRRGRLIL